MLCQSCSPTAERNLFLCVTLHHYIVVNLCDNEDDIKKKIIYWISFLANQYTSVTTKPHVIVIGSHSDVVKSRGEDPTTKVNIEFLQATHVLSGFSVSQFIPMDCRQSNSSDIFKLTRTMKNICYDLIKQFGVVYHLHQLFTFLFEKFRDVSVVRFEEILESVKVCQEINQVLVAFSHEDDLTLISAN